MWDDVVDEAIEVATQRTRSAQETVADEIAEIGVPDDDAVVTVIRRAEDLERLTREAIEESRTDAAETDTAE